MLATAIVVYLHTSTSRTLTNVKKFYTLLQLLASAAPPSSDAGLIAAAFSSAVGLSEPQLCGIAQLDNVLLDGRQPRPNVKLCDFGYSKDEVTQSVCKTACGTPEYMSPEVRPYPALTT